MALSFTEGSIGGDIETREPQPAAGVLRQRSPSPGALSGAGERTGGATRIERHGHRAFEYRRAPRLVADQSPHVLLLPLGVADGERRGAECLWRRNLGPVLHLPGIQRTHRLDAYHRAAWMRWTSISKACRRRATASSTNTATKSVLWWSRRSPCRTAAATRWPRRRFTVYRTHHGPVIRETNGKWVSIRLMQEPVKALEQSYARTKTKDYKSYPADHGTEGELVEQHHLRRRRWRHRLLPRQLHSEARYQLRLDQAGGWQ